MRLTEQDLYKVEYLKGFEKGMDLVLKHLDYLQGEYPHYLIQCESISCCSPEPFDIWAKRMIREMEKI